MVLLLFFECGTIIAPKTLDIVTYEIGGFCVLGTTLTWFEGIQLPSIDRQPFKVKLLEMRGGDLFS